MLVGHGNNGEDGTEGARAGTVFATYLHGPVLPRNAWLADHLLAIAAEHAGLGAAVVRPLDDGRETAALDEAIATAQRDTQASWRRTARRRRAGAPPADLRLSRRERRRAIGFRSAPRRDYRDLASATPIASWARWAA